MAIFRLQITPVTRSTGRSATSAAAYRAGERIRDERTGRIFNHSARADVLHKEIILPGSLERRGAEVDWARNRAILWNLAEKAEIRSDSRVAREYQVALPPELPAERRIALARTFSRELADRYRVAVDLAVHEPRPGGDPRNFHAHLLATTRELTSEGLGPKSGLDMEGSVRSELGLPPSRQEFVTLRRRWAELANEALREANVEARIDHRSLEAQGIDREPRPRLPWAAIAAERRGERSEVAERIRSAYRTRVAARLARAAQASRAAQAPLSTGGQTGARDPDERRRQAAAEWQRYRASQEHAMPQGEHEARGRLEELRRQAVEAWRRLRAREAESRSSADRGNAREHEASPGESTPARRSRRRGGDFSL